MMIGAHVDQTDPVAEAKARSAPLVPIVTAKREASVQPLPIFAAAPSPSAGKNGTVASARQRAANSGWSGINASRAARSG